MRPDLWATCASFSHLPGTPASTEERTGQSWSSTVARYVTVVSDDPQLLDSVSSILGPDSRFTVGENYLHCDGTDAPLTNIYPIENGSHEWENWRPGESDLLNPEAMSLLLFETRSPDWVAEVGLLLARGLGTRAWFVDSADVAWPVGKVDPGRIVLA